MTRIREEEDCCAWPAEGRSVLHIERSWPAIRAAPTDRPMSSSTCCSQFLHGRPGGRFQSAAGGVLVWASIDSCSACEAGVFSGRRQMWPNNEWRLSAIRDGTSGSFVLSLTSALDSSPLVNSLVRNWQFKTAPDIDEPPFQFIHAMDLSVVDTVLHDDPDLVIYRTEIWAACLEATGWAQES